MNIPVDLIIILTQVSNHVSYISNHVSYIYRILYRKHQWMWCKHTIVSYEKFWLNTKHHYKRGVYYTYKHHVHMYMCDYMYVHVYTIQCIVHNYTQYLYQNLDSIFLI